MLRVDRLARHEVDRFSVAQNVLVDACVIDCSSDDARSLDMLQVVWHQFQWLLDAEYCVLSVELVPATSSTTDSHAVIEIDGREIRRVMQPVHGTSRARQRFCGARRCPVFLPTAKACAQAHVEPPNGCSHVQVRLLDYMRRAVEANGDCVDDV